MLQKSLFFSFNNWMDQTRKGIVDYLSNRHYWLEIIICAYAFVNANTLKPLLIESFRTIIAQSIKFCWLYISLVLILTINDRFNESIHLKKIEKIQNLNQHKWKTTQKSILKNEKQYSLITIKSGSRMVDNSWIWNVWETGAKIPHYIK